MLRNIDNQKGALASKPDYIYIRFRPINHSLVEA